MGIWNQYRLARQVGRESQRPNFGGLLSSAYFSAARHDRHMFQCPLREASSCGGASSAPGGRQFSGAAAAALPASAIFQRWRGTLLDGKRLSKVRAHAAKWWKTRQQTDPSGRNGRADEPQPDRKSVV